MMSFLPRLLCGGSLFLLSIAIVPAAENRVGQAFQAIRNNDIHGLQSLLDAGFDVNERGDRSTTPLMYAAAYGSIESFKMLLDKGADPNAKNALDATALMWAIGDAKKVQLLLNKGADVNAQAKGGRTALLLAAMRPDGESVVRLLLAKGADIRKKDDSGSDTLLYASGANVAVAKLALQKGADAKITDAHGGTALMNAAGLGDLGLVRLLLSKGANPNAVTGDDMGEVKNGKIDLGFFTPLMLASTYGPAPVVDALLKAGAKADAKDRRGMTPLHYALSSDHQDMAIIQLLLAAKPDLTIRAGDGQNAIEWAQRYAHPGVAKLMNLSAQAKTAQVKTAVVANADAHPLPTARAAVENGLAILSKVSGKFLETGGCVSCHAQNLTTLAIASAAPRGIHVPSDFAKQMEMEAKGFWQTKRDANLLRQDPPGGSGMMLYALLGMASTGYQGDWVSDSMIHNVVAQQALTGEWARDPVVRAPMEDSEISRTAMAVQMIRRFSWPGQAAELSSSVERAAKWLANAKPFSTEDRAFQIVGLAAAGDKKPIAALARNLVSMQRADGGWGQSPYLASDAYATGQALYALASGAGFDSQDPAFRKGVDYLLRTQHEDGSWHVKSRSARLQPYFQSGFPYDHDQWISMSGTAWATIGLTFAVETAATPRPAVASIERLSLPALSYRP